MGGCQSVRRVDVCAHVARSIKPPMRAGNMSATMTWRRSKLVTFPQGAIAQ
jgi:hypothetical protein